MRLAVSALAALCALGAGPALAQERPDFTGVWRLASPPMTSAQGYPDLDFTPEGAGRIAAYRALVDPAGANPTQYCVTHGMPEMMMGGGGYPLEVIQKPDQVTMISEAINETRRIYLGDRIVPDSEIFPSRHGYSKGRWEGDVLVVETAHLQEMVDSRFPHSASATVTERYRMEAGADGAPRLIAETVFEDDWLEAPLEYTLEWAPAEVNWMLPYECMEQTWFDAVDEMAREAGAEPVFGR